MSSIGTIEWQKCYGGTCNDEATEIKSTPDGGYIISGWTCSNDGDVAGNHQFPLTDYWVVKLSSIGSIEWQKCLGGTRSEVAFSIKNTTDGGYILAGYTASNDGDVAGNHQFPLTDCWVVKLSSIGSIEWQKCLGGTGFDGAKKIEQTPDGGYILAGYTESNDGDVAGNHGGADAWVVKLSTNGNLEWQKCLGGSGFEYANSLQKTSDGGYIILSDTTSNDGDVAGNDSGTNQADVWIVKLNPSGVIEWQKCFGGSNIENAMKIQQTPDSGYIYAGWTYSSNDGDISGNHDSGDIWVVKLTSEALGIPEYTNNDFEIYPNPAFESLFLKTNNAIISIEITDLAGKIVKVEKSNLDCNPIRLDDLDQGFYILRATTEKKKYTKKFVKK